MTHFARTRRRLSARADCRVAGLVLAVLACIALFAEVLAADAPVIALGNGRLRALVAVSEGEEHARATREELDRRYAGSFVVWPLVRQGPLRRSSPGEAPSMRHPLGTDDGGRDVFATLVHGTRRSVAAALAAVVLSVVLGVALGGLAGLVGGAWDELLARAIEVVQAFPSVVAVTLAAALAPERSWLAFAAAVAATRWAVVARMVRGEVLRTAREDHVLAARGLGAKAPRLLLRHLLPAVAPALACASATALPSVLLLDAALGYLGLGRESSWGALLAAAIRHDAPWVVGAVAGIAVVVAAGASKLLADGLADALDPRGASSAEPRPEPPVRVETQAS